MNLLAICLATVQLQESILGNWQKGDLVMEYRLLGNSGLRVSELCVGSAWFGVGPTEEEAPRVIGRALDLGINFFDTAFSYGNRASADREGMPPASDRRPAEEMIGSALKDHRHEVILTTKVGELAPEEPGPNGGGRDGGGLSRYHITRLVEASLRRLQTDYIDIYHAHWPDPTTPLEETLQTFDGLVRQGKIRYYAFCNYESWQIVHALWLCDQLNLIRPISLQMGYNLALRQIEDFIMPVCKTFSLTMNAHTPLGGGLLTGAENRSRRYIGRRRMGQNTGPAFSDADLAVGEGLDDLASKWGYAPTQVAIAWLLNHPHLTSAIIGPEFAEEVDVAVKGLELRLDSEQMTALDVLSPRPRSPQVRGF